MPELIPISLFDVAHATGTSGTIPVSAGPGALPSFTKDVSALTVQPSAATVAGTLARRFGRWQDVVNDHGAVGNGSADDTSAFLAARAAAGVGGTVYAPPGTYLLG